VAAFIRIASVSMQHQSLPAGRRHEKIPHVCLLPPSPTRQISPYSLPPVAVTVIGTIFVRSAVKNSIQPRPTRNFPAPVLRISVETCGCFNAKDFADLRLRGGPRGPINDLVGRRGGMV